MDDFGKLSVGHFVINFPSKKEKKPVYGSERITYILCKELSQSGSNVDVFVPFYKSFKEQEDNINVHFYNSLFSIGSYHFSAKLLSESKHYDLDVVHVHNDSPIAMYAGYSYSKKKKVPLVVTWHGDWLGANLFRRVSLVFLKPLVRKVLSQANIIILPAKAYAEESIYLKDFKEKIVEIPHGIEVPKIDKEEYDLKEDLDLNVDLKTVLYVSSLSWGKGADLLVKTIPQVLEKVEAVQFIFVGGGDTKYYMELAKSLGVENYVKFTGYVEWESILKYYGAADLFVFPSRSKHEVFPVVTLEASSLSLPMVVSPLRILRDRVIDGYNGLYFDGTVEDLADKIIYLLMDEEKRNRVGKNAKRELEMNYTSAKMAEKTVKLYKSLLTK